MPKILKRKNPIPGTVFYKTYKNKEYKLEVIEVNKKICFKLLNKIYNTPTGAARSITNNDINGWKFWKID